MMKQNCLKIILVLLAKISKSSNSSNKVKSRNLEKYNQIFLMKKKSIAFLTLNINLNTEQASLL
jgi:hypothetical protein